MAIFIHVLLLLSTYQQANGDCTQCTDNGCKSGIVTISTALNSIANYAFSGCNQIVGVIIPTTVTAIGYHSFDSCSALINVVIPTSMVFIDNSAFLSCTSLKSVAIPSSVSRLGDAAFQGCTSLISAVVAGSAGVSAGMFQSCSKLSQVSINSSIPFVGNDAFKGCSRLTQLSIGTSVASFGQWAFSVAVPSSVSRLGDAAFQGCTSLTTAVVAGSAGLLDSVIGVADSAFSGCGLLSQVLLAASTLYIKSNAFQSCSSLKYIFIPSSVTLIGYQAFASCTSLSCVLYADKTQISIDATAFQGDPAVTCLSAPTTSPSSSYSPTTGPTIPPPSIFPSFLLTVPPTSNFPTGLPTISPSFIPTGTPSVLPSCFPSILPTASPSTCSPTFLPTLFPTFGPSAVPTTTSPSSPPTNQPTKPTSNPTMSPSFIPTSVPIVHTLAPANVFHVARGTINLKWDKVSVSNATILFFGISFLVGIIFSSIRWKSWMHFEIVGEVPKKDGSNNSKLPSIGERINSFVRKMPVALLLTLGPPAIDTLTNIWYLLQQNFYSDFLFYLAVAALAQSVVIFLSKLIHLGAFPMYPFSLKIWGLKCIVLQMSTILSVGSVWNWWFYVWTGDSKFQVSFEDSYTIDTEDFNFSSYFHLAFESLPLLIIQSYNGFLLGKFNRLTILSICFSAWQVFSALFPLPFYVCTNNMAVVKIPIQVRFLIFPFNAVFPPRKKDNKLNFWGFVMNCCQSNETPRMNDEDDNFRYSEVFEPNDKIILGSSDNVL
eukprot:gene32484-42086_t